MRAKSCAMKLDITDYEGIKRIVQAVEAQLGPIDILVNNAAVMDNLGKFDEQQPERWQRDLNVDLTGTYNREGRVARHDCVMAKVGSSISPRWLHSWGLLCSRLTVLLKPG